ncbi:hypothetical protein HGRIS_003349 [Hohenbuehelia grisea]|uniref:Uncharacterized protein n=1 Tax=Hohenbuehelia grisea TaxID=104357 RepID=A0ABR3JGT0_9AGAR
MQSSMKEEAEWEDVSGSHFYPDPSVPDQRIQSSVQSSPAPSSRAGTPRKRKPVYKTTFSVGSPSSPVVRKKKSQASDNTAAGSSTVTARPPRPSRLESLTDGWADGVTDAAIHASKFTGDIILRAVKMLRHPLSILVFLWLLALIMSRVSNMLRSAFSPLCFLPGISSLGVCLPDARQQPIASQIPRRADYPKLVDVQSNAFEKLLDQSTGSSGLSFDIRNAELATRDLVALIRLSKLKSKDLLADSLGGFVDDARKASRSLQKLHAKIGGAVDGISAVNDYALHSIEEAHAKEPAWYSPSALVPWSSRRTTQDVVKKTFKDAMDALSWELRRLILQAEHSQSLLDGLEEHLATLHDIISREDSSITEARAELLANLWTMLGGNRGELRGYESHLMLLKDLGNYRKRALKHVVAALQMLRGLSDDMEELRERVALPELAGPEIPIEVHLKSIQNGLDRLKAGRLKAREVEERAIDRIYIGGREEHQIESR